MLLLTLLSLIQVALSDPISHPELNFNALGDRLSILGSFDSISYYSQTNETSGLSWTGSSYSESNDKLFLRTNNSNTNFANVMGNITNVQPLSNDTILINGDFDEINNTTCTPPIIYNLTNNEITNLFPDSNRKRDLDGLVSVSFVDGDLIYLGGNFQYQDSYGAVVYNQTSQEIVELPFKGFGENSTVNAITKIGDDDEDASIVFGGYFDTLGIPDLLLHNLSLISNSTRHSNFSNTSLVQAEQKISLQHGIITDVNGDGSDPSRLVCPSTEAQWSPQENSGGQWLVELPNQMKGITPTKVRLYVPEGEDSINLFRIYSYPNNGIMNLTYVDPDTNEILYCDAWCPLSTLSQLRDATEYNLDNIDDLVDDDVYIGEDDGTYSTYYDPSTQTKTLSYASNFQEFSFENDVSLEQVGLTVISWYGSKGAVAGFELYSNSINVFGNETLNEPNCGENLDRSNTVEYNSGDFNSIASVNSAVQGTDYQVSIGTEGKVTMYPNITYSGDYSIIMITPGCIADGSCSDRSIVNISVIDSNDDVVANNQIYQNNDYEKFDFLFYGHLDGSSLSEGQTRIEIEFDSAINPDVQEPWMVIDRIRADIVELDDYYDRNSTNRTRTRNSTDSQLVELSLHGLFEYSLANFSYFEESFIYSDNDQEEISTDNTFVGNSTINVLSSRLSSNSTVDQFNQISDSLLILGDFTANSTNLTLSNGNVISLALESYNTTSNSSIAELQRRSIWEDEEDDFIDLVKREEQQVFDSTFNDSIINIDQYEDYRVLLGQFSMTNDDESIIDLSNDNSSVDELNNFALYDGDQFYSFGNDYIDEPFDTFTHIELRDTEFFIFSHSEGRRTWDNTNKEWIVDPNRQLNISQVVNLSEDQQVISGSSFAPMDGYLNNLAFISNNEDIENEEFHRFNANITGGSIEIAYHINDSLSVIGGDFEANGGSITNVALIANEGNRSLSGLQGDIDWSPDTSIQSLYVDSDDQYLFVGYNGSASIDGRNTSGGVVIYDLSNNSLADFQPAELTSSTGSLEINSVVLYNHQQKLLVGGRFDNAGSLDCQNLCIYDMRNTRWESPNTDLSSDWISDIIFVRSNAVLVVGDLNLDGEECNFAVYNIAEDQFSTVSNDLNDLDVEGPIKNVIMSGDSYNDQLEGTYIVSGDSFLRGFDGSSWSDIEGIEFSDETEINDLKLLTLDDASSRDINNGSFFERDQALAVAGRFELTEFGLVNVALFNGRDWIPMIYTSVTGNQLGSVNSLLLRDRFRSLSLDDINRANPHLSSGKVVGISLACALGSTTFLSLLYIIPYFALFRKSRDDEPTERIGEKEMMDAVNPEDLFHEIDLQRHH